MTFTASHPWHASGCQLPIHSNVESIDEPSPLATPAARSTSLSLPRRSDNMYMLVENQIVCVCYTVPAAIREPTIMHLLYHREKFQACIQNLPHACHQKTLQEQWQTHRISDRWKLTFGNVSLEISPPADCDHPDDITFYLESVLLALLMPQLIIVLGYRTPKPRL